jgi:hypothetical protein
VPGCTKRGLLKVAQLGAGSMALLAPLKLNNNYVLLLLRYWGIFKRANRDARRPRGSSGSCLRGRPAV